MAVDFAREEDRRPIRLVVLDDDLRRNATVFLRLVLALPHFAWLTLWGIATYFVAFVNWLAVLINGEVPGGMHGFAAGYLRYATHVSAYVFVVTDAYPGFRGAPGYAIDLEIDPPVRQSRWSGLFRLLLALPALILAGVLGSGFTLGGSVGGATYGVAVIYGGIGASALAAMLTWFTALAIGRAPRGLRDLMLYAIGYGAQVAGYLLLLTARYPSSDPVAAEPYSDLPEHPVRVVADDDVSQSRLTVFFRLLLAIPHFIFLLLWSVAAFLAVVVAWFAALVTGRVPASLHRFLAAFVRYGAHVVAYAYLLGRRFPGFTGRAGIYEVDLELPDAEPQSRWKTLFRLFLAIPALILASALSGALFVAALFGWFYALATGRMPRGLRNLGISCLRYSAQTYAYLLLVTDRYPYAAPVLRQRSEDALEPVAPAPAGATL